MRRTSAALACAGAALVVALTGCPNGGSGTPQPSVSPQPADSGHLPPPPSSGTPETSPR